ncbi:hypothetical protein QUB47_23975 [Microcoleus sp. AT9_B5]
MNIRSPRTSIHQKRDRPYPLKSPHSPASDAPDPPILASNFRLACQSPASLHR